MPIPQSLPVETIGNKIRRKANAAAAKNPFGRPPVCTAPNYQWGISLLNGQRYVNGGNVYVVCAPVTSASSGGGPTGVQNGGLISENSVPCFQYVGKNIVTTDPNTAITTWSPTLTVTQGQILVIGGLIPGALMYGVVSSSGNVTGSTPPSATTNNITDGTATLTFYGYYNQNPYAETAPTLTSSLSSPGTQIYTPFITQKPVSAQGILGIPSQGSGYAVNDTITLTGGTASTAVQVQVTSVNSGAITGAKLITAGSYTGLPQSAMAQGSTSGSGTGATFNIIWPNPQWCNINNGYLCGAAGVFGNLFNFSTGPGQTTTSRHISWQFMTDDPAPCFQTASGGASNLAILYDEGNGWIQYNQSNFPFNGGGNNFFTLTFPTGRKWRKIKFETAFDATGAGLPQVYLSSASIPVPLIDNDIINCAVISDSLFDGNPTSPFSCGFHFAAVLGYLLDWNVWDFSKGGTGYINNGSYSNFLARVPAVLASNPNVVMIYGSTNDISQSGASTTAPYTAVYQALRNGGFGGPIIVWGLEPVSANALTQENYVAAGVLAQQQSGDDNIWFVPFANTNIPPIMGTYNNNPTPGGVTTMTNVNNFSTYINQSDNVHPLELAVVLEANYGVNSMKQNVFPLIS